MNKIFHFIAQHGIISKIADYFVFLNFFAFAAWFSYEFFSSYRPVAIEMAVMESGFSYENNIWSANIDGIKVRDCIIVPATIFGFATAKENGNDWLQVPFNFTKDDGTGFKTFDEIKSRNPGYHQFGEWNWQASENTKRVKVIVKHICEETTLVETVIGPFKTQ